MPRDGHAVTPTNSTTEKRTSMCTETLDVAPVVLQPDVCQLQGRVGDDKVRAHCDMRASTAITRFLHVKGFLHHVCVRARVVYAVQQGLGVQNVRHDSPSAVVASRASRDSRRSQSQKNTCHHNCNFNTATWGATKFLDLSENSWFRFELAGTAFSFCAPTVPAGRDEINTQMFVPFPN